MSTDRTEDEPKHKPTAHAGLSGPKLEPDNDSEQAPDNVSETVDTQTIELPVAAPSEPEPSQVLQGSTAESETPILQSVGEGDADDDDDDDWESRGKKSQPTAGGTKK